jgi:hypothetical protein
VQERVVNLESSFEEGEAREDTGDGSFVLGAEGSGDEDVDGGGCWWWQSTEAKAARWVVPQWEVLAADRGDRRAEGRAEGTGSERKGSRRLLGAVRSGKPRTREHNRRAQTTG